MACWVASEVWVALRAISATVEAISVAAVATRSTWPNPLATPALTSAMTLAEAAALRASLRVIAAEGWRRERLQALHARLREGLAALPWEAPESHTAIQPVILGDNGTALSVMAQLEARGIWVPAIRPPTVPVGTARLRISLVATQRLDQVDRLVDALGEIAAASADAVPA